MKAGDAARHARSGRPRRAAPRRAGAARRREGEPREARDGRAPEEIEEAKARAQTATAAFEETARRRAAGADRRGEARASSRRRSRSTRRSSTRAARTSCSRSARIPQAQVDDADTALKRAIAQRDAAKQALDELEERVAARGHRAGAGARARGEGERDASSRRARASRTSRRPHAQVEAAQGRLDQIQTSCSTSSSIRAPRDARVESLDLRPGDILAPNATAATLLEDDQLYVRIYVPETQLGHIHVGQEVPIAVDSFPGRAFKGVVEHINQVGEYSPRNLQTADERATRSSRRASGFATGATICARAWPRSSTCRR